MGAINRVNGGRFEHCFQWIVGENPDQRKIPLTSEMERGTCAVGGGVPFTL